MIFSSRMECEFLVGKIWGNATLSPQKGLVLEPNSIITNMAPGLLRWATAKRAQMEIERTAVQEKVQFGPAISDLIIDIV